MPGKIFLYAPTPVTSASVIAALGYTPADVAGSTGNLAVVGTTQTGSSANSFFSITGTWNTTGTPTADLVNVTDTASNAASLLMDRQVGGVSKFKVNKAGEVTVASNGSLSAPSFVFGGRGSNWGFCSTSLSQINLSMAGTQTHTFWTDGSLYLGGTVAEFRLPSGGWIDWNGDTYLYRDAANTLAQRNGTTAQAFRVYNTFTDASNYERGIFDWTTNANILTIGASQAGTGTARILNLQGNSIQFYVDGTGAGTNKWTMDSQGLYPSNSGAYTLGYTSSRTIKAIYFGKTYINTGTTGAQTINTTLGSVNFAAGATSLVVTNSLVGATTNVQCTIATNDATMKSVQAVVAAGSFTIYANVAPTAETRVNFVVFP